jgi:hypothetical protein
MPRSQGTKPGSLVGLSPGLHEKLTTIRVGHGHPVDLAVANVDARCPEGDETIDLLVQITVDGWDEVET